MKTLNVILIGAGSRGRIYTDHMTDDRFRIVAVAEPVKELRDYIKNKHNLSDNMCFDDWKALLAVPRFADIAIIATSDSMHYAPAMKAIELGYNLLLEKPVAPTYRECRDIADAAKKKGVKVLVCHVLRYTAFFRKIKDLINGGELGKVVSIPHSDCVGNVHQSTATSAVTGETLRKARICFLQSPVMILILCSGLLAVRQRLYPHLVRLAILNLKMHPKEHLIIV